MKIAVKNVGLQEIDEEDYAVEDLHLRRDAKLWVLNGSVHVTSSGRLISPEDSPFVWLGNYKKSSNVCTSYKYASAAEPVQPDKDALTVVVRALHASYLNNFPPSLLSLGAQLLNLHFQQLLPVMKGVPIALLYGAAACGKSTAMITALSLLGTQSSHLIGHCPDVTFFRMTTKTTLGLVLDDPSEVRAIHEKVMILFEGQSIEQKDETIKPRTTFMTSLNTPCFRKLVRHHR